MSADLAYVNGVFSPLSQATISINDRGLLFGDAVYEVIKAFSGQPFLLTEHLLRLQDGLDYLGISAEDILGDIPDIISQGLARTRFEETLIHIQISRGSQERNLIYPKDLRPNIFLTFRQVSPESILPLRKHGVSVITQPDIRWEHCNIKSTNLLGNVLLRNLAAEKGCYEAILLSPSGTITEACSSSVFIVKDQTVITTPLSENILPGVNRSFLVNQIAPSLKIPVREEEFNLQSALHADEVFLTATTIILLSVVNIDGHIIGNGQPGPLAQKLLAAMLEFIEKIRTA